MPANKFEIIANWYLRFNGYFTTTNFTVHPDYKKQDGGTEADILAVRFPFSREYQKYYDFKRDPTLVLDNCIDFLICEVKSGLCDINQNTWGKKECKSVDYALRWMGFEAEDKCIEAAASNIYRTGSWSSSDGKIKVRLVFFGERMNKNISLNLPLACQKTHIDVISYLKERFCIGCHKIARANWERDIIKLAELSQTATPESILKWAYSANND